MSSKIDSRTILDRAVQSRCWEWVICSIPARTPPRRCVSTVRLFATEVHAVVQDWKARGRPQYVDGITSDSESEGGGGGFDGGEELDPLFDRRLISSPKT